MSNGRLYAVTAPWWWATPTPSTGVVSSDGATTGSTAATTPEPVSQLKVYGLNDGKDLVEVSSTPVMQGTQVRGEAGGHLLLTSGGYGYGVGVGRMAADVAYPGMYYGSAQALFDYALTNPDQPSFRQSIRTPGWVQGLAALNDELFISSGIYGIQKAKLTP